MQIPGTLQPIENQAIGTVIGLLIKTSKYKRAAKIPDGDNNYLPPTYYLSGTIPIPMTAITQEAYEYRAEVTEHPVESGAVFSDHAILKPLRIEIEFETGNYDGLGQKAKLARQALDKALQVVKARQLVSLLTTHRMIENAVCLSIRATNAAPEWGTLRFRATFQEVSLVTLERSKYPAENVQGEPQTNKATNAAVFPGGPVTPKSAAAPSASIKKTPSSTKTPFKRRSSGASGSW